MVHIPADVLVRFLSSAMLLRLALPKNYGLNATQFMALLLVGETAVGLTIKDLRERLAVPGSSLTFTLDSLEAKRLIKRQRSRVDRRQWNLVLTDKGRELYSEMLVKESQAMEPSLASFTEAERDAFLKISEEITKASATAGLAGGIS